MFIFLRHIFYLFKIADQFRILESGGRFIGVVAVEQKIHGGIQCIGDVF
ncbi:hypothetical protein [Chitinophaga rhizosphaerae]|nr:hypothetical protein [Chitinophaga rhizosphaerae]